MNLSNDGLVAFHYRSYGTFFLQQNRLYNIYRGFTHYKYYRARKENSFFPFLRKNAERNKIITNVYGIILVNNSQKRLRNETACCRFGWS